MPLKKFIKENAVLTAGIALPVLLVIGFMLASTLPRALATPPQYKLLVTLDSYNSSVDYRTQSTCAPLQSCDKTKGKLIEVKIPKVKGAPQEDVQPKKLYIIDPITMKQEEVSFAEARQFELTTSTEAPDGYQFDDRQDRNRSGFVTEILVGHSYNDGYRIRKGSAVFKITPLRLDGGYYAPYKFLGWVKKT